MDGPNFFLPELSDLTPGASVEETLTRSLQEPEAPGPPVGPGVLRAWRRPPWLGTP